MTILTMKMSRSKIAIVITAAGSSTRMGGGVKKEYLPLKNGTVLSNCAKTFLTACSQTFEISDFIVTCPVGGIEACQKALGDLDFSDFPGGAGPSGGARGAGFEDIFQIVEGSTTRQKSVFNGLVAIKNHPEIVLIHDGARPFVSEEIIRQSVFTALEYGSCVPGCTPVDTQKEIDSDGFIIRHLQRSLLCAVQTPQTFNYEKLLQAHKKALADKKEYTDDTEIWGNYCGRVKVIPGDPANIKITYPGDLEKL